MLEQVARVLLLSVYFGLVCIPCFGQEEKAALPKEITNSMGMKFVLIPAGRFTMGSPASEKGSDEDETLHKVEISKPYYLAIMEVTQGQYATVMGQKGEIVVERDPKTNRVIRKRELDIRSSPLPVVDVSWEEAVEFCKRLSLLPEEKKAGRSYRLPTEAEWEYACRAGTSTAYSFGDNADALGQYASIRDNAPQPVGTKKANPWGLYDMHGNVCEWCSDWYGDYPEGLAVDPSGASAGEDRVFRGGSWGLTARDCRSANRDGPAPGLRFNNVGFRLVSVSH
jgi:formylglycine-generating enzyme required for sulfatase activity